MTASTDCEDDYVQFGRDILFITSYRSAKFCNKIQVNVQGSIDLFDILSLALGDVSSLALKPAEN